MLWSLFPRVRPAAFARRAAVGLRARGAPRAPALPFSTRAHPWRAPPWADAPSPSIADVRLPDAEPAALTADQARAREDVLAAYLSWWDDLPFRKGWSTPAFAAADVARALARASEYVVRIRSHLDQAEPGMKLRMPQGSAHDLFRKLSGPPADEERFLYDLVHATFKVRQPFQKADVHSCLLPTLCLELPP